jgi:putative PIN family toxin of toxin-antitoxin system
VRVTLDTNVYVSAFEFQGMGRRLLHMAVDGDIEVAVSAPIIRETLRVLREKFGWDGYRLNDAKQQILGLARLVEPVQTLDVVKDDPDDNRIVECAVEAGSAYIVTKDKDLLRMGEYGGIKMIRPADFLKRVMDR